MQVVSLGNNLRKQEGGSRKSETGNEKTKCILLSWLLWTAGSLSPRVSILQSPTEEPCASELSL